ncbi:unnamed protein product [Protopolystoma xenopodis]|uniref:Uncharacterized protein n=1 Tax=Protopolystoma xenopodis TaxID=117903 RepID=A0A448XJ31_9PLAT|nr:unnamed protein product [Protopolystoma xenopodis]
MTFIRPQLVVLMLSLEVRRNLNHINSSHFHSTGSSVPFPVNLTQIHQIQPLQHQQQQNLASNSLQHARKASIHLPPGSLEHTSGAGDHSSHYSTIDLQAPTTHLASAHTKIVGGFAANVHDPSSLPMTILMATPVFGAPVFGKFSKFRFTVLYYCDSTPVHSSSNFSIASNSNALAGQLPLLAARREVIRLFEQVCWRRSADLADVLPELVEVVLACLDRTCLKERGLDFVFPALQQSVGFR